MPTAGVPTCCSWPEISVALWWLCEPPGLAGLLALLFFDRDSGQWVRPGFALIDEQIDQALERTKCEMTPPAGPWLWKWPALMPITLVTPMPWGKAKTGAPGHTSPTERMAQYGVVQHCVAERRGIAGVTGDDAATKTGKTKTVTPAA